MADLSGFDANTVEPNSFDCIPAGDYEVAIVASEMKPTKDGDGKYLNLEFQVLSGQYQNRKLFDRLNLVNKSELAVQIARGTLSAICRAVGVPQPLDSSELHLKPMVARVRIRKSDEHGDQNEIKGYKPRHTGVTTQTGSRIQADAPSNEETAPWKAA